MSNTEKNITSSTPLQDPSGASALPALQEIFYKQEINSFIQSFVISKKIKSEGDYPETVPTEAKDVLRDITEIFRKDGFLTPDVLREKLTEKYLGKNSNKELQELLGDVDRSTYETDSMTEFLQKPQLGIVSGLGHLYARTTDIPVTMFEVDYSNMGGTNDLHQIKILEEIDSPAARELIELLSVKPYSPNRFDSLFSKTDEKSKEMISLFKETQQPAFKLTDDTAKLIALSIEKEIRDVLPEEGQILPVRAGGDELRLIVVNLKPDEYENISDIIHQRIEEEMAKLDLHDHVHLKRASDPLSNGYGAALSMMNMRTLDPASAVKTLDDAIKSQKIVLGRFRNGEIDEESLREELLAIFEHPQNRPDGETQPIEDAIEQTIEASKKRYKEQQIKFDTLKQQAPKTIAERQQYIETKNNALMEQRTSPINGVKPAYLEDITTKGTPFSTPAQRRESAILDELERRGVPLENDYQRDLVHAYAQRTTPIDPSSGAWMPNDMPAIVEIFTNDAEKLQMDSPYIIGAAFHNLGGLNEVLGHDGANIVLKEMHHTIILDALQSEGFGPDDYQIAHYGGAEFNIVLKPRIETARGTKRIDDDAIMRIEAQILANTNEFSEKNILNHLKENGVTLSAKDEAALKESGAQTYGEIKDIKTERDIDGIDVVTSSSKINLHGKTAGFFIQQHRDQLSENVSAFRNQNTPAKTKNKLKDLYNKIPNIDELEAHLGSVTTEFQELIQLKGMVESIDRRIGDHVVNDEYYETLDKMRKRYLDNFNEQAISHGTQDLLEQAKQLEEHKKRQDSPLTNMH